MVNNGDIAPERREFRMAQWPRFPMMATIDITKLSAKVLDYTDAEDGILV